MLNIFFQKYNIASADILIVACSGGPDSMYLLLETMRVHPKDSIVVAHFNHRLRAEESDREERFVRDFCAEREVRFESGSADIWKYAKEMKIGIEEAARERRYEFLKSIREKYKARFILTAHHLDDSIETVVFNFIRGTKLTGLMGIPEQNGFILRPLISTAKSEILDMLTNHDITYCLDSSNDDKKYLRNRIRTQILPEFSAINPEYRRNLRSFMDYAGELEDFIDTQVRAFLQDQDQFGVEAFQALSLFLQREIIRFLYERANHGTIGLSEGNIAEVIRFIGDKGNKTKKQLRNMELFKDNGVIYYQSLQ